MDPMLDEVDEQDRPTGRLVVRNEVCGNGTSDVLHRCVGVYAFDPEGRMYLQTHKKSGLLDHSVGGHVDTGEDYATAAKREAAEELGLVNVPFHELGTSVRSHEPGRQHMFGIYECFVPKDWVFAPNDEVDNIMPMLLEDVVDMINHHPEHFTGGLINTLKFYLEVKKSPLRVLINGATKERED
ncbi:MAG TPA: NUDIX domain-containing protein [Patescibacteria group bacterium]|nr:NUDIX domain-containing protein [Patescibacteria group bacterium]